MPCIYIQGVPFQEVVHFPLKPRLQALLRCESFVHQVGYESYRQKPKTGIVSGTCFVCLKKSAVFVRRLYLTNISVSIQKWDAATTATACTITTITTA